MIKIVEEFKTHIMEDGKSASNLGYDMVGIYSLTHIKKCAKFVYMWQHYYKIVTYCILFEKYKYMLIKYIYNELIEKSIM